MSFASSLVAPLTIRAWDVPDLENLSRLVLLRLAFLADAESGSPTVLEIAQACGIGERSVQYHLRDLERLGLIAIYPSREQHTASSYYLFPGISALPVTGLKWLRR